MKTEKKKKCKTDCACKPKKEVKGSNGKGDKPRPSNKNTYDKNYENINWSEK